MEWLWAKYRHNLLSPRQIISSRKGALTTVSESISLHSFALKASSLSPNSFSSSLSARKGGRWCLSQGRGGGQSAGLIKTGGWEKGSSSFRTGLHLQPSVLCENGSVFHKEISLQTSAHPTLKTVETRP